MIGMSARVREDECGGGGIGPFDWGLGQLEKYLLRWRSGQLGGERARMRPWK